MKKVILAAAALTLLVAGIVRVELVAQTDADSATKQSGAVNSERAAKRKAMIDAANQTYEAMTAEYEAGTLPSADQLYVWSSRMRSASTHAAENSEAVMKACQEHLDRMRRLQAKVKALYDAQAKGGEVSKYRATKFYVAEAEWLLLEAKADAATKTTPNRTPRD